MRKQPGIEHSSGTFGTAPTQKLTVLCVSSLDEDHWSLRSIVRHTNWVLWNVRDLVSAREFIQQHRVAVVVCERDLLPGTWIDMLEYLRTVPEAPTLIVSSRLADERLWAEALNLGAWDVLAKPFDRCEVIRSVKSGWEHWHDQVQKRAPAGKTMAAAAS